jgi:hypothetical protein
VLYIVPAYWVESWADYVVSDYGEEDLPDQIINDQLFKSFKDGRELSLIKDFYMVSEPIWSHLYQWYLGGPVLKWHIEFEQPRDLLNETAMTVKRVRTIRKGDVTNDSRMMDTSYARNSYEEPADLLRKKMRQSRKIEEADNENSDSSANLFDQARGKALKPSYRSESSEEEVEQEYDIEKIKQISLKLFPKQKSVTLFGLENNSLFCYLNTCIQCIFGIPELREYYLNQSFRQEKVNKPILKGLKYNKTMHLLAKEMTSASE